MPTYVYQREDGTRFEVEQRITAEPLTHCPTTGQKVRRVISGGTGLIFKGSGFYLTDYARGNGSAAASPTSGKNQSESEPATKKSESTDKPDKSKESSTASD